MEGIYAEEIKEAIGGVTAASGFEAAAAAAGPPGAGLFSLQRKALRLRERLPGLAGHWRQPARQVQPLLIPCRILR